MAIDIVELKRKHSFKVSDDKGADIAEDMFQTLLDAPLPLQVGTLYEEWYRCVRNPIVRKAAAYRREAREEE